MGIGFAVPDAKKLFASACCDELLSRCSSASRRHVATSFLVGVFRVGATAEVRRHVLADEEEREGDGDGYMMGREGRARHAQRRSRRR